MAPRLLIAGAVVPAAAFGILYRWSSWFRRFLRRTDPRHLTLLQVSRVVGAVMFAREYSTGNIPAHYGLTVAACDFTAGITAPFAARWSSPGTLEAWNWFGLAAIVISGGSGVVASSKASSFRSRQKTNRATTSFPVVLVPMLFGPVTLLAHLMALTVLRDSALPTAR